MSKLSDLIKAQSGPEEPEGMTLDLSANCGVCYQDVDEAEYFPGHKVLRYKCSNGHISYLEDFTL